MVADRNANVHTSTKQVTSSSYEVAKDRSYEQFCGVARALDLVGERWALLVVRELLLGPRRFTDLLGGLPSVSTNVLAARLRQLEGAGVVERGVLPPPAASAVYQLTPHGRDLEPIVLALGRWGARSLGPRGERRLCSQWLALALKSFFHAEAAEGVGRVYEVRLREGTFRVSVREGVVEVEPGPADAVDAVLEADDDALVALLAAGAGTGGVRVVEGDPRELDRFVELFRFAEPAPAA
jgi:DNA-binding HxlR family transcriptional regulator